MMQRSMTFMDKIRDLNRKVSTPMLLYDASMYTGDAWEYAVTGIYKTGRVCLNPYIEADDPIMADLRALGRRARDLVQDIEGIRSVLDALLLETVRDMEEDERMAVPETPGIASADDDEKVSKKGVDALLEVIDMEYDFYYAYNALGKASAAMGKVVKYKDLEGRDMHTAMKLYEGLSKCRDDMLNMVYDARKVSDAMRKRMMEEIQ